MEKTIFTFLFPLTFAFDL